MMGSYFTARAMDHYGIFRPRCVTGMHIPYHGADPVYSYIWEDREKQRLHLERKREVTPPRLVPAYVWTFDNGPIIPYGGWWCYVVTRTEQVGVNFRGILRGLAESVMRAAPCGFDPAHSNLRKWMPVFADTYPRKHPTDKRPAGVLFGWYDTEDDVFALTKDEHDNRRSS